MRGRPIVVVPMSLGLCFAGHAAAAPAAPTWKLAASDIARYDRRGVTTKDGAEKLGAASQVRFDGRAIRDDGVLLPGEPVRGDLPTILGLSTPTAAGECRLSLVDAANARLRWSVAARAPDAVDWTVDYQFESGRPEKYDAWEIRDGTARAHVKFDAALGAVRSTRVEISYTLDPAGKAKDRKSSRVDATWQFDFVGVSRCRYAEFQSDVNKAIERGLAQLKKVQKDDGSFEPHGDSIEGTNALAAYTLASCGVPREDPGLWKAMALVCAHPERRTYTLSVGLMALERAYAGKDASSPRADMPSNRAEWCAQAAATLESIAGTPGTWNYPPGPGYVQEPDTSNTQYAALGLHAATKLGIAVKDVTWTGLVRHFERVREKDAPRGSVSLLAEGRSTLEHAEPTLVANAAGFRYRPSEQRAWGAMTCAGIASLTLVKEELRRTKNPKAADLVAEVDEMIAGGWAWLDTHWRVDRHVGHPSGEWHYYYLYSLERAGIFANVLLVGGRDWYFEGAVELLARQDADGAWDEPGGGKVLGTCFALLYLKRATMPITPK